MAKLVPLKWNITDVRLGDLIPWDKNPRFIDEEQLDRLSDQIKDMGFINPMIVDEDMTLIAGHQRRKALFRGGATEDTWIHAMKPNRKLTEEEFERIAIGDNLYMGEWDMETLKENWNEKELLNFGFSEQDLGIVTTGALGKGPDSSYDDGFTNQSVDDIKTAIKEGDIIQIGPHRLACGNSEKPEVFDALFGELIADLVWTDPPYGVDYSSKAGGIDNDDLKGDMLEDFIYHALINACEKTKPGGGFYCAHADSNGLQFRQAAIKAGWSLRQNLIWVKDSFTIGRQDYQWQHEPILYGWKPGGSHFWQGGFSQGTVIDDETELKELDQKQLIEIIRELRNQRDTTVIREKKPHHSELHPTMKPVPLVARFIFNSSKPDQIVLDPFLGSGTSMVASHQLDRRCFGIELDPRYCQIIVDRMRKIDPELKVTIGGKNIDDLKVE